MKALKTSPLAQLDLKEIKEYVSITNVQNHLTITLHFAVFFPSIAYT